MQSEYSSELTTDSQTYSFHGCQLSNHYYEAIEITVVETNYYMIISNSTIDMYGTIYENNFNPINRTNNEISYDDQRGCNEQFKIIIYLRRNTTYVLVVTTVIEYVIGTFSVIVFGPKKVNMNLISKYHSKRILI